MQLRDTPDEAAFRAEVRAWLDEHNPGLDGVPETEDKKAWSRKIYDAGYAGLTWPEEYGGQGASYSHQAIAYEEWARAEAPGHLGTIGLGMAGPTIIAHGTDEQKQRYLANILSAEEIWCQGFSEPGAGSDLSAVRTSAELRDGHFVVSGQKVWSSYAHLADWCILVTRSDPESQRHAGLTYMVVDMHSPGVEVRPLRHITGDADFNEIFFENVEVPVENVLDEIGNGWAVAMTTLLHERGTLGFALTGSLEVLVNKVAGAGEGPRRPGLASPRHDRARVGRAPGAQAHELPRPDEARRDGDPRPGGLGLEAPVVGGDAADDEARARDPGGRGRRVVAPRPAPHARQHDRGRHVGDPPQHHRRARARPPEVEMRFAFTEEQDELRRQARALLDEREPTWDELAELGWLGVSVPEEAGGAGLGFVEEAVLFEELGRALYPGPYFATVALALPQLPPDEQALVASGQRKYEDRRGLAGRAGHEDARVRGAGRGGRRHRAEGARAGRRAREEPGAVRQADRHLPGGFPPNRRHVRRDGARAIARLLGRVVRRGGRRRRDAGGARRQVVRRRDRRRRVRAVDPGARRHRLHLGAPAAPLLQAGAVDRGLRRVSREAARRDRRQAPGLS